MNQPFAESLLHKALLLQPTLYTGLRDMIYFTALEQRLGDGQECAPFWLHVKTDLFGAGVMNWCKLFGVDKEDPFWKQVTLEHPDFRRELYRVTGLDYQGWYDYRRQMSQFRNAMLVHPDPYADFEQVPEAAPALASLKLSHRWLHPLAKGLPGCSVELLQEDFVERLEASSQILVDTLIDAGSALDTP